jgi:hypothetical protein
MMSLQNPEHTILSAKRLVESDRRSEIRLNANGGNSILVVCEPMRELEYIEQMRQLLPTEGFELIDLNQMLTDFVSQHKAELMQLFESLQITHHLI